MWGALTCPLLLLIVIVVNLEVIDGSQKRYTDEEFQQREVQDQCNKHYERDEDDEGCILRQGLRNGRSTAGINMRLVYDLEIKPKPWADGFTKCMMGTYEFASIKNYEERKYFAEATMAIGWDLPIEHLWVAAAENSSAIGGFSWKDGSDVNSQAWAMGYPKIYGTKKTCVSMGIETSMLYNFDCSATLFTVCYIPR